MTVKSGVFKTRDDVAKCLASIKRLTGMQVLVGVPSEKAQRDEDAEGPINNAQLAYIHTYGATIQVAEHETTINRKLNADGSFGKNGQFVKASKANFASTHTVPAHEIEIPARPFLVPGIENAQPKLVPKLRAAAKLAVQGDFPGAEKKLHECGLIAQNSVRAVIGAGIAPPLAASTLRNRRARGRSGDVPLIDTAELRNSITYVVRQK